MKIEHEDIDRYREKHGAKRLSALLNVLGKQKDFITAIQSKIGKEIMEEAINEADILLTKIANLDATQEETMKYQAYKTILSGWIAKISKYEDDLRKLKEG